VFIEPVVHGGGDAAQQPAAVSGQELGHLGVSMMRMPRGEEPGESKHAVTQELSGERRGPVRIAVEQHPRDPYELPQPAVSQCILLNRQPHNPLLRCRVRVCTESCRTASHLKKRAN
jgi:hypothetical protein